jgi:hypothetical protein
MTASRSASGSSWVGAGKPRPTVDEDERCEPPRMVHAGEGADEGAHRVTGEHRPLQPERLGDRRHVGGVCGDAIGTGQRPAAAPAPQVGRDQSGLAREVVGDPGPGERVRGDAVHREHDGGARVCRGPAQQGEFAAADGHAEFFVRIGLRRGLAARDLGVTRHFRRLLFSSRTEIVPSGRVARTIWPCERIRHVLGACRWPRIRVADPRGRGAVCAALRTSRSRRSRPGKRQVRAIRLPDLRPVPRLFRGTAQLSPPVVERLGLGQRDQSTPCRSPANER